MGDCRSWSRAWKEDHAPCKHIDTELMSENDILHLMNCRVVQYDWLCLEAISLASLLNAKVANGPHPHALVDRTRG